MTRSFKSIVTLSPIRKKEKHLDSASSHSFVEIPQPQLLIMDIHSEGLEEENETPQPQLSIIKITSVSRTFRSLLIAITLRCLRFGENHEKLLDEEFDIGFLIGYTQ
ncbi:hypothetical protein C1H46_021642 [Malus baccata]|uniref:Uncharacterized protein n=1 Tax=Malus baccata TaxID=106549 RepID=A0A540M1Z2_MALBA|nr:hypothetical protein C1H46_021642 [Malus baccata]